MNNSKQKKQIRIRRHNKVRSKIIGTPERPRLSVFRSNKSIYAQIIDDVSCKTLVSASDIKDSKGTNSDRAALVGEKIAKAAKEKNITKVVFDRGGYSYAGRVKILADAARKGGLDF